MDLLSIVQCLEAVQHPVHTEDALQVSLNSILVDLGFEREYITVNGRPDFFRASDGIGIEVKIQGRKNELLRQLAQYAELDESNALILVTSKPTLAQIPDSLNGKPIAVAKLYRSIL